MDVKNQLNLLTLSQKYECSSFKIFHQNIRGLKDKHDELICSLNSFNINPHLLCISEYYTIEHNLSTISQENYKLAVNFSHVKYQGGGMCILLGMTYPVLLLPFPNYMKKHFITLCITSFYRRYQYNCYMYL
jgi:hypothetical protein